MMSSRTLLLLSAAACFALLGVALYLQHGTADMLPCPLCVIQRYLFLAVAVGCLVGAFGKTKPGAAIGLLGALGGLGVAGKHLYVLAHPGLSCGIDPLETALNKIFTAEYLPFLFRADGLCEDATAPFFGLSIPQWSFVWFGIFALAMLWTLARRK